MPRAARTAYQKCVCQVTGMEWSGLQTALPHETFYIVLTAVGNAMLWTSCLGSVSPLRYKTILSCLALMVTAGVLLLLVPTHILNTRASLTGFYGDEWLAPLMVLTGISWFVIILVYCLIYYRQRVHLQHRTGEIEGPLNKRLLDGTVRLVKISWLERDGWRLVRHQELPPEALYTPLEASDLLRSQRVAALSYRCASRPLG